IIMVGALYIISRDIFIGKLVEIEKQDTQKYVERALSALSQEIFELERITVDWSSRDETYAFIEDANSAYIESNLVDNTFITLRLNFVSFINSSGQIVFNKAFDLDNEEQMQVSPDFLGNSFNDLIGNGGVTSGIILVKEGPMIVASQPILTSSSLGPARGTLVFGRYINDAEIEHLAQLTVSNISMGRIDKLTPDFEAALPFLREDSPIFIQALNNQQIAGYNMVTDIYGKPVLILRVILPRETYIAGQDAVIFYILVVLGVGIILSGIVMWVVHKQVLLRTAILIKGIRGIASTGDTATRLIIGGKDELAIIASTINGMLAVLQETGLRLRQNIQEEKELRLNLEREIENRAEYTRALVHELKTPITPIMAASDLLSDLIIDETKEPLARDLVKNIHRSTSNLNKRVDELLDLARGEVGQLKVELAPVDVRDMLVEAAEEVKPTALIKEQSIGMEIPDVLQIIMVDQERLQQVLLNLLNNAIKYSPKKATITIRAREDSTHLIVEVEDTGRGISKEDQGQLFNPYHRIETDKERLSGLGLGLAIAKTIVELHGGQIWVNSIQGKGSTFIFNIPLKPSGRES
ncbi:CHASE4 domain-containing protein, partial [Chloroflexota bacterium]